MRLQRVKRTPWMPSVPESYQECVRLIAQRLSEGAEPEEARLFVWRLDYEDTRRALKEALRSRGAANTLQPDV